MFYNVKKVVDLQIDEVEGKEIFSGGRVETMHLAINTTTYTAYDASPPYVEVEATYQFHCPECNHSFVRSEKVKIFDKRQVIYIENANNRKTMLTVRFDPPEHQDMKGDQS